MSQSNYCWVIVAAGGLPGCVAIGAMFSLPVFLRLIAQDTGWSITGVSSAMTIAFVAMAGGLGMATGPVAGGLIYDSFASYSWLFVISFGLGIGAFLISLTFKPFPRKSPVPAPA